MTRTVLLGSLLASTPAHALFHLARIAEINAQGGGAATVQYVEIEMELGGQHNVANSVLGVFACDGAYVGDALLVPANVGDSGVGVRWVMATATPLGGIAPDFATAAPTMPAGCGQVCWGAPGGIVPLPETWDHTDPDEYVDCVAYGGYGGPTRVNSGTPTSLPPGDGTFALVRVGDTNDNATDFALACPSPENNLGAVGTFGPCAGTTTSTSSSTSSTTTTSSSTTSTLPTTTSTTVTTTTTEPTSSTTSTSSTSSTSTSVPSTSTTSTTTTSSSSSSSSSTSSTSTSTVTTSSTSTTAPTTSTSTSTSTSTTLASTTTSTTAASTTSTTSSTSTTVVPSTTSTTSSTTSTSATSSTSTSSSSSSSTSTVTTTSTSTPTSSSSSTTTLPGGTADLLPGKKLELRVRIGSPQKSRLFLASRKDAALGLGRGAGSPDDPTQHGGRLVVASDPDHGDFTTVYPLDATTGSWKTRSRKGVVVGYAFKGAGPIRSVAITAGKTLVVMGKGEGLGHDLGDNPNPVTVVLEIGAHAYCLELGGNIDFRQNSRFRASSSPAPAACAPPP